MSWPLFFAQTPGAPATPAAPAAPPAAPAAPPAAPATPAAPVEVPATPAAPVDVPATPAAPTTPAEVPIEALSTPAQPVTDVNASQAQPVDTSQFGNMDQNGLNPGHWVVLIVFAGVCLGLISTVMFSTSKSDLGGGIMGGGAANAASFRGKKSGEEKLSQLTSWFATAFIIMSIAMTFMFRS